ncbi:AAA family ATPase [Paracnuella aquatica]|uniref:AAA family ATPase n=1 Tax=Paracnuella aquatica TaxID=2268757 RepID=UPI000DEF3B55|nr:ATP-binding protein [Paracnuella aquatica]RPD50894.1 ATPase [Paracnuella aquatica]
MKKVVVIGPEATGKSTLCEGLAAHYGTLWVPEYARHFLLQNGTDYTFNNLLQIAQGQQALEESTAAQLAERQHKSGIENPKSETRNRSTANRQLPTNPPLIIDTNQYVMKVWCEVVFGACHPWILKKAALAQYDLYLLCNVDLPWVQDGLREQPDPKMRQRLFLEYKDILVNDGTPWAVISGNGAERLHNAIQIINQHLY